MATDPAPNHIALEIGTKVKALRTARGLSGRKLAAGAGVSQPFLSQLESGQTSVAIATLYRIAGALGVGAPELLPNPPKSGIEVLRAPELYRMTVSDDATSALGRGVFRSGRTISELFDYVIEPGQHIAEWFESVGEHAVYAVDGSIRIEFEGHDDVILGPGDVVFYSGVSRHRWHLVSNEAARIILVATRP